MLSKIFRKNAKKHEFEIQEVKLNKKVISKSAAQEVPPVATPVATNSSKKKKIGDLSSLEKHYYDQIKGLLKKTTKESIKQSILNSEDRDEITKTQLLAILDMF